MSVLTDSGVGFDFKLEFVYYINTILDKALKMLLPNFQIPENSELSTSSLVRLAFLSAHTNWRSRYIIDTYEIEKVQNSAHCSSVKYSKLFQVIVLTDLKQTKKHAHGT